MKSLAVLTILALGLAAPALAQSPDKPAATPVQAAHSAPITQPAPAAEITDATPLDVLVQEGSEDRAKMLMRCVGPPVRLSKQIAAIEPASEPALAVGGGADTGG